MSATDLYQFPEVYAALRSPRPDLLAQARAILAREAAGGGLSSLMDPACGPGNWLLPFAQDGVFVAGNDLSSAMVRIARRELAAYPHELVEGDMRELRFESGPFDAALEIAGTASLLSSPTDLGRHLKSVAAHLKADGVFLLTLFFADGRDPAGEVGVCHEHGPVAVVGGGEAGVRYEVLGFDREKNAERMRRTVWTRGVPGCPERIVDEYSLRLWTVPGLREVICGSGVFDVLDMDAIRTAEDDEGERTVVLRKVRVGSEIEGRPMGVEVGSEKRE